MLVDRLSPFSLLFRLLPFSSLFRCLALDSSVTKDSCTTELACISTASYAADLVLLQTRLELNPRLSDKTPNSASIGASDYAIGRRNDDWPEYIHDLEPRRHHVALALKTLGQSRGGMIARASDIEDTEPTTSWLPRLKAKLQALRRDLSRLQKRNAQRPANVDEFVPVRSDALGAVGFSQLLENEPERSQHAALSAISFSQGQESDLTDELYPTGFKQDNSIPSLSEPLLRPENRMPFLYASLLVTLAVPFFCAIKYAPHGTFGAHRYRIFQCFCFLIFLPLTVILFDSMDMIRPALHVLWPWLMLGMFAFILAFPCAVEVYLVIFNMLDIDGNGVLDCRDLREGMKVLKQEIEEIIQDEVTREENELKKCFC